MSINENGDVIADLDIRPIAAEVAKDWVKIPNPDPADIRRDLGNRIAEAIRDKRSEDARQGVIHETMDEWIKRITTDPEIKKKIGERLREIKPTMTEEEAERFMAEEFPKLPQQFAELKRNLKAEAAAMPKRPRNARAQFMVVSLEYQLRDLREAPVLRNKSVHREFMTADVAEL
jgi:hypothetical protein